MLSRQALLCQRLLRRQRPLFLPAIQLLPLFDTAMRSIGSGRFQPAESRLTYWIKIGHLNPIRDSDRTRGVRVWGMRAGVTLSVSSADLDRLPALVSDRNAPLL